MLAEVPGWARQALSILSSRMQALGQPVTAAGACPWVMVQPTSRLCSLHEFLVIYITASTAWSPLGRLYHFITLSLSLNSKEQNLPLGMAWPCPSCARLCRRVWHSLAWPLGVFQCGGWGMFALNMPCHCEIHKLRPSLEQWVFQQISSGWISRTVLEAWSCRG